LYTVRNPYTVYSKKPVYQLGLDAKARCNARALTSITICLHGDDGIRVGDRGAASRRESRAHFGQWSHKWRQAAAKHCNRAKTGSQSQLTWHRYRGSPDRLGHDKVALIRILIKNQGVQPISSGEGERQRHERKEHENAHAPNEGDGHAVACLVHPNASACTACLVDANASACPSHVMSSGSCP
jgi:hypothetical protein